MPPLRSIVSYTQHRGTDSNCPQECHIQVSQTHHHYYHGCKHERLGCALNCTRVRRRTIWQTVDEPAMPTPHQCVRASSSSSDPPTSGAGTLKTRDCNWVQHSHSVIHQKAGRSGLLDRQCGSMYSVHVPLGNHPGCPDEGDSLARVEHRLGPLTVLGITLTPQRGAFVRR